MGRSEKPMNELKPEDVMRALAWYEVVGKNIGSVTLPYDELKAIAALLREKDAEIERLHATCTELTRKCASLHAARAEAITEFALRLKSCEFYEVADQYDGMQYVDFCVWVDQIAEKLKGETNGESDL
jgi:hypothetical protein